LTAAFDFNGKEITISGNATISPAPYSYVQFSSSSNPVLLTIADGSSIVFDGFNRNIGYGGVIYSGGNVTISGTSKFTNNVANSGGAIYSVGDVTIIASDGDIVFEGNNYYKEACANNFPHFRENSRNTAVFYIVKRKIFAHAS
jgi:predicted outer membrane repeat protein